MNNKKLGTAFEREVCEWLRGRGYWVHFITPDARGAQPFDIIAVKNGRAIAIECKTLNDTATTFNISRLEDNQILAFEYWGKCGNDGAFVFVKWRGEMYAIPWVSLRDFRVVKMAVQRTVEDVFL